MSRRKGSFGSRMFDICNIIFMLLIGVIMLYPFLNVIAVSISSNDQVMMGYVAIIPKDLNFGAYQLVLKDPLVWRSYLNTVLYAIGSVILTLGLTALLAYPLSVDDFKGKKAITVFLTITMFFNGGLIPT